jgi:hypothetical protein
VQEPEILICNKIYKLSGLTSKILYWHLLQHLIEQPTSIARWISEFPFLHDNDFDEFFLLPYRIVRETRLQTFQYKILNNILACKERLFKWNIEENDQCMHCDECDTITHFMYNCTTVRCFWRHVENWMAQILGVKFPLSVSDVLFGIPFHDDNILLHINYIILLGKWYIYTNRTNKSNLCTYSFVVALQNHLEVERYIMHTNGLQQDFEKRWSLLYDKI